MWSNMAGISKCWCTLFPHEPYYRFFLFEISDSGIILGGLIEVGIFGGIKNNLKIRSVLVYSAATILRKHYNQTSVCFLEIFKAWKNSAWGFWGLIFGPEIFGGFVGSPRDFGGGLWFLHPFDHPRHLKTGFGFPLPVSWEYNVISWHRNF